MTYTVTNTADLAGKPGWSFTTTLPEGLTVADPADATTDCADGTVTAEPGSTTIAIAGGLASGVASCEVSVTVASIDAGTYSIGAENLTDVIGVRLPTSAPDDGFVIAPLSVSEPGTYARSDVGAPVIFYAYVEAGETLDVTAIRNTTFGNATSLTVTIEGPGGVSDTCTAASTCTLPGLSSPASGIWRIMLSSNSTTSSAYTWEIDVSDGGATVDGRVWAEEYRVVQCLVGGTDADLEFWYQSEYGFTYAAAYAGFNGCFSSFSADATGIRDDGTCTSAYVSIDESDPDQSATSPGECGDPYKIFFEQPAADLPASAVRWDGATDWVAPEPVLPEIASLNYTPDGPTGRSGTIDYQINNFTGQVVVEIDTDNDGTFDLAIPGSAIDGVGSVSFDGLDGDGNPVSMFQDLPIRLSVAQAGEIHFMNVDVEIRTGGIEVTKLNGPQAGDTTVYWDDTELSTVGRCPPPALDGTAGVPSGGGVHGWPTCTPAAGTWGNLRIIDDWTYHSIDEFDEIVIPAEVQPPWECGTNAPGLLFQTVSGAAASSVYSVDLVTGSFPTPPPPIDGVVNSTGFNVLDGFIYGLSGGGLVRIGSDGSIHPMGIPLTGGSVIGDVDDNGHYWNYNAATGFWIDVDIAAGTTTTGTAVSPAPTVGGQDWAYIPGTNALWRVAQNEAGTLSYLVGFDRTTHTWTTPVPLGNLGGAGSSNTVGAVFADPEFLYASYNFTGEIWRVDVDAGTAAFFANGPAASGNDGARCPTPILLDFGDAPDSYTTTLAFGGPRHGIPGFAGGTAPLMLGASIDPETNGAPGVAADGDGADDDGVSGPIVVQTGMGTSVTVNVTNSTGEPATLAGWIDLDGDGVFGAAELISMPVGASGPYVLDFPEGTVTADTYARFRLYPGLITAPLTPGGAASAGEVEDYPVTVLGYDVVKSADPDSGTPVDAEGTVEYTITVTNLGSNPIADIPITDDLTGVLDDATLTSGPTVAPGGAGTASIDDATGQLTATIDLAPSEVVTITYSVTVNAADELGDAVLENAVTGGPCPAPPITDPADPDFDPDCVTVNPIRAYTVAKISEPVDGASAAPGDVVLYTLIVTSTGTAPHTLVNPATASDDLTAVLDDAVFNDDAVTTPAAVGTLGYVEPVLSWSGPLAIDDIVTISYTVTVNDADELGDGILENVVSGGQCPAPPITDPADPEYDPDCHNIVLVQAYTVVKTSEPAEGSSAEPGDSVLYTLTVTNTGAVPYTDLDPATASDDLTAVLDDAVFNDDAATDPAATGTLGYAEPVLSWSGPLAIDDVVEITYSVTVDDHDELGDSILENVVTVVSARSRRSVIRLIRTMTRTATTSCRCRRTRLRRPPSRRRVRRLGLVTR